MTMRVVSPERFVAEADRRRVITRFGDCTVWRWDERLAGNCVWGEIRREDAPTYFACLDALLSRATGPFDYLADNRRMRLGDQDADAFGAVFDGLSTRNAAFSGVLRRLASVPPDNAVGLAIVGATEELARHTFELGVFADTAAALAWLAHPEAAEIAAWLDGVPTSSASSGSTVERVRAELDADPTLPPDRIARRLGMSARSLQRALAAAGTTLGSQRLRARIARATVLLAADEAKVEAIAREVGFRSATHFIRVYRDATGVTPGRARRQG